MNEAVKELAERIPEDAYPMIIIWGTPEGETAMIPLGIELDKLPDWLIKYAHALKAKFLVDSELRKH